MKIKCQGEYPPVRPLYWIILIGAALLSAACGAPQPEPPVASTPAPIVPPGPTLLPTATATPLPTPTPTPTAAPVIISDDLRARRSAEPVPQRGAPCGVVDFFDFPLGAPDGEGAAARWLFGRYSDRYQGIHAGEDWVYDGGSSLGKPVYAIGHGQVLYAQPLGWGVDKGVIIIRHVFADGSFINSFYGHLDPPSVTLKPGDCVTRGEHIADIGQPRGRPHLHFEIRRHLPDTPGPGYWSVDPQLAGWLIPTDTIWDNRIQTSPGVKWTRVFTSSNGAPIGVLANNLFAAFDDDEIFAADPGTGQPAWTRVITGHFHSAALDTSRQLIYVSTLSGTLQAVTAGGEPGWSVELPAAGLLPMPGSGVVANVNGRLVGLAADAQWMWETDRVGEIADWLIDGDRLIISTKGDAAATYALERSGALTRLAAAGGRLALARGQLFVYNPTGIHHIDETTRAAGLLLPLDAAYFPDGDLIAAYDGALLVTHRSASDQRLIALNADGSLRWDRSIAALGRSVPRLIAIGRRVYAVTQQGDVLLIDQATGDLWRIFDGGGGTTLPGTVWARELPRGYLAFDFRAGRLVVLDPLAAGPLPAEAGQAPIPD